MQPNADVAPILLSSLKPEATVVSPNGIQQDLSIRSLCSSLTQSSRVLRPVQGSQLWTGPSAGLTRRRPTCSATSLQRFSEHCAAVKGHSCPQKRDVTAAGLQLCDSSTCWRCSDPPPPPTPPQPIESARHPSKPELISFLRATCRLMRVAGSK